MQGPAAGPRLVLLHGLSHDWKSFSVLLPELSSRYHLFAVDLRGHGGSSRVSRGYRIAEYAQDVSAFLKQVVPGRLGQFLGIRWAGKWQCVLPRMKIAVSALIVGDSVISPENFARSMYDPLFLQLHQLILRGGSQEDLARGVGKIEIRVPGLEETLRIEELPGNTEAVFLEWARSAMQTDPDALAMTLDGSAFLGWDPVQVLPRITCPVLLLQGNPELDALLTDDDVKLALRLLPRGEHVKFPLLGHALFMQQAKPVLQAVVAFLGDLSGRKGR